MKRLWQIIGISLFWLAWPIGVIYFHCSNLRSRVLVICGDEVLLVKGWLSTGMWSLPGGGAHKNELPQAVAARELSEETGIIAPESSLVKLGSYRYSKHWFNYHSDLFYVLLPKKPELKLRTIEIYKAQWFAIGSVKSIQLDDEAAYALQRYRPPEQASLL